MDEVRHNWSWMFTAGCLMIVLGVMAVLYSMLFTLVSVMFLGWVLIVGGILEGIHAFQHREGGHLFLYVLEGLLALVAGILLLKGPVVGALVVTLLLASYFIIAGIVRIVASIAMRFPSWQWMMINGVITLALGLLVWGGWPASGLWVLGLFVGIDLIFAGWARVMLALALKSGRLGATTVFAH